MQSNGLTVISGTGLTVLGGGLTVASGVLDIAVGDLVSDGDVNVVTGVGTVTIASTVTTASDVLLVNSAVSGTGFAGNTILGRMLTSTGGNALLLQASGASIFQVRCVLFFMVLL